jgi:L-alanine-DL-glutamate epimerase-like enolase superfamily enzyme
MKLKFWTLNLTLAHRWAISGRAGSKLHQNVLVQLTDDDRIVGLGEAAPASTYGESAASAAAFLQQVDPDQLSFADIPASMRSLEGMGPGEMAAKCALNVALVDGAAKRAGQPVCDFLGLGFLEKHHVTSISIGIDTPEIIREKTIEAEKFPILKLKVGDPGDRENLAALRKAAPAKPVRVDANEAWKTKEEALEMIEWLAQDGRVQFVEQPMPHQTPAKDFAWLKARSPLPLFGDESYHTARDVAHCAECFHGINVKLVKTGGITAAHEALVAARHSGLKTMIGCMIETSVLISAGAHLANLADYLDLDGNLLITNDPYAGVTAENGILSFANAPEKTGLRVRAKA